MRVCICNDLTNFSNKSSRKQLANQMIKLGTCVLSACRAAPLLAFVISFALCGDAGSLSGQETADQRIDFNRDVRPIFIKHCTACHGGVKQAADISFVYADQVVAPEGWIVEPGEPDESILLERVVSDDPDERMPPLEHGPALNQNEVDLLTRWIKQGAKWSQHWAFEKPQPQELPKTVNSDWPRQSVDHYILASLEAKGIDPATEASAARWLRRASIDLTGLPPTLEERGTFLDALTGCETEKETERIFTAVVDRLLASPSFGERWASVWLDQIRYADSKGLGIDGTRNIWKYRDWVIDAFNRDMPYDQFTIKQMAGDLLPNASIEDHIATAAHRLTQTNEEGGTDDEEFRIAAVLDRSSTTWQTWQGVTFGCAQCHSHPYDPIRHDEYYKFAAFFNNTADTDLGEDWPTINAPIDSAEYKKASKLDRQISDLKHAIWSSEYRVLADEEVWNAVTKLAAKTNNETRVAVEAKTDHQEFHTVDTVSKDTDITLTSTVPSGLDEITAIRFTAMPLIPETALTDSEWGFSLSHVTANWVVPGEENSTPIEIARMISDEPEPFYDPTESLNAKSNKGFAAYTRIYRPRSAALVMKSPSKVPEGAQLQVVLKHRVQALGAFPLVTKRGHLAVTDSRKFGGLTKNISLNRKRKSLADSIKKRNAIKSTSVPVCAERPAHLARTQQVFIRGLFLTKDKTVTADTPTAFGSLPEDKTKDRLALANWLVSPDNPLTARVAVNRMWARMFGIGLVATEEDFGSSGEPPSHPALLDHLAIKFQNEFAWSQKKLLRELVLSSTYRQSSAIRPELQSFDSANRLLARGPRNRLSSEMVRDQSLAISGLLSAKQFGPPVRPPIPEGVWNPFAGGDKWKTPGTDSEDRYRRAVYTYTKRSIPFPMFDAFDAPSREVCMPRRLLSNTPIQALMNLNDQTMIECAEAFAKRMQTLAEEPKEQLAAGFLLATCRDPQADELGTLLQLLNAYPKDDKVAGWQAVATVLLNLDEVLTK